MFIVQSKWLVVWPIGYRCFQITDSVQRSIKRNEFVFSHWDLAFLLSAGDAYGLSLMSVPSWFLYSDVVGESTWGSHHILGSTPDRIRDLDTLLFSDNADEQFALLEVLGQATPAPLSYGRSSRTIHVDWAECLAWDPQQEMCVIRSVCGLFLEWFDLRVLLYGMFTCVFV